MADANQELFDATIRHQVALRRFTRREIEDTVQLLERADRDLLVQLRERLVSAPRGPVTTRRLEELLKDIRATREAALRGVSKRQRATLRELARAEAGAELARLEAAVPIDLNLATVPAETLRAVVSSSLFHGRPLEDWYRSLRQADRRRLDQAIRLGLVQGETTDQIVRRVAGTRAARFQDGALAVTRREAAAITRTAVTGVSDRARNEVFKANREVVEVLMWASTLDGRTTELCMGLDGGLTTVDGSPVPVEYSGPRLSPPGIRPPAHVQCRSAMVAVLSPEGVVGKRPVVRDTRTRRQREIDFRKIARQEGTPIQQVRREWAEQNVGRVPADTTYTEFLRRQPATFQDEVLGPARAQMFRDGKITHLRQFTDASGKKLTLEQLRAEGLVVSQASAAALDEVRRRAVEFDTIGDVANHYERMRTSIFEPRKVSRLHPVRNKLKDYEAVAINEYTAGKHRYVNGWLRGVDEKIPESFDSENFVAAINSGLEKLPNFRGKVYRGSFFHGKPSELREMYPLNSVVTEKAFTSTSKSPDGALSGNVSFVIKSKTGKAIDKLSPHVQEQEVLFRSGTRFRVEGFRIDNRSNAHIFLEEIEGE